MLAVVAALTCPAMASDSGAVDLTHNGSISVTLLDNQNSSPVSGAGITLYRVAGAYNFGYQLSYVFTDDFKDCGMKLDNLRQDGLATHLTTYANAQGLKGIASKKTDANGLVTFSDIETGLYLVLQTKITNGYYAMDPFLVSVPMTIANEWVYDVDASPKLEVNTDEPDPETPEKSDEFPLIQTGQLNWPIPVLAGFGMLLLVIGFVLSKKNKHYD